MWTSELKWTLDNTHPLIDGGYFSDEPTHSSESVPIGDDPLMLRRYIWKVVDQAYKTVSDVSLRLKATVHSRSNWKTRAMTGHPPKALSY